MHGLFLLPPNLPRGEICGVCASVCGDDDIRGPHVHPNALLSRTGKEKEQSVTMERL